MRDKFQCCRKKSTKCPGEEGYTFVEVLITVIILGLIIGMATFSYVNITRGMSLSAAIKHVEEALTRAKTAARQENVDCRLVFYPSDDPNHPNTFEFLHNVYDEISTTWSMQPVNRSVTGEKVIEDGGHWYIEVVNNVEITGGQTTVTFDPTGTVLTVTPATINLQIGGTTGSVTIESSGKISSD